MLLANVDLLLACEIKSRVKPAIASSSFPTAAFAIASFLLIVN